LNFRPVLRKSSFKQPKFFTINIHFKPTSMKKICYLIAMLFLIFSNSAGAQCGKYLVFNNSPWGQTGDQSAMNTVFGTGGWTQATYSTSATTIFSASNCFVMLEGSEIGNVIPLSNLLILNHALIENWVSSGGRLFINAAPNEGGNINCGFGGTVINYAAGPYSGNAVAVNTNDPIFQGPYTPIATSYSGGYFAHAGITGTGLTNLLLGNTPSPAGTVVLAYKKWGSGVVFFGTETQPAFWSPQPQSFNLWYNIFSYTNTIQTVSTTCNVVGTNFCSAQAAAVTVNYTVSGTFNTGNIFTAQLSNATGSFASPVNIGSVTATASGVINASIPAGTVNGTGYRIRVVGSNPLAIQVSDNGTNIQVSAGVVPSVSISANPGNLICSGSPVTFTAVPVNGGVTPAYQWKKNGNNTGTNSNTYSDAALLQNDIISCILTSNASCITSQTAISNSITMNVNALPVAGITNNTGTTVLTCNVTSINVTATGGSSYQWDHSLGSNPTVSISSPGTYVVTATNLQGCTSQASIIITQNTIIPGMPVAINGPASVCGGGTYTYTIEAVANANNYTWFAPVNATIISGQGTTSIQLQFNYATGSGFLNVQSENNGCTSGSVRQLLVSYTAPYTPGVSVAADPAGGICPGTSVTFTATANPVEVNPSYQWFKNNIAVGTNSNVYTDASLVNGDIVNCILTSTATCVFAQTATSNSIVTTINPLPLAAITNNAGTTVLNCTTTSISVTATGGVSYDWDNGLGSGASKNITSPGNYHVTVTSAAGCVSEANIVITQNLAVPATPATVNGLINICPYIGDNTQLTYSVVQDADASSYQWILPPYVVLVSGQGTNSITVTLDAAFANSANKLFKVKAISDCGSSAYKLFYLLAQLPNTPNPIVASGTNVCPILNTAGTITYTIPKVLAATSYIWITQAGNTIVTHPNGAGVNDTIVQVSFGSGFTSSLVSVQAVNGCGTSNARSLNVTRNNPSAPGLINGATNVCSNIAPGGTAATYSISDVTNATSYNWNVPPGSIGLAGQGTNTISFTYPAGFTNGSVSVTASNGCGTGSPRILSVTKLNPATPSVIDVIQEQPCPNRIYSYTLSSMPANATSVQWTIPSLPGVSMISGQGTTSIRVSYPDATIQGFVTAQSMNNCGVSVIRQTVVKLPACPPPGFAGKAGNTQNIKTNVKNEPVAAVLDVHVFPNPTTSDFNLLVKSIEQHEITARLFDLQGRQLKVFKVSSNEMTTWGNELKAGVYILEITEGNNKSIKRLLKL
jgi:hypothetical protein